MKYPPIAMTWRTQKIREEYLKMPVPQEDNPYLDKKYKHFCTGDRWITLGFLEGWLAHVDAPTTRRRRSYAEAAELYAAQPIITEHELLTGHLYLPEYTPEEQKRYDQLCEMFRMSSVTLLERGPRIDHLSLDLEKLLRIGISGIVAEIHARMAELNLQDRNVYPEFEVMKQYDFYECCLLELEALKDLQKRYAQKAREMAETAPEPRKSELSQMAEILEWVPEHPARNFREALQSVQFFLGTLFGLYPLNRPDRYLYPYYAEDVRAGVLTRDEAQELIDNFCLHVSTRVFSRAACGFIVGGQDAQGNLVENELTYMFLTALEHIRMPDPNGALAVNDQTSDDILHYSVEILSKGITHPAFYNDSAIVESLMRYGCSREDAVNYIHTTCAEISVVGKTKSHTTPFMVALPKTLKETVRACGKETTFAQLQSAYIEQISMQLSKDCFRYVMRMLEASRNGNEPMRVCCLVEDCISRGRSIFEGGERYSFLQPILVGFSTAVDSLIALKTLVFEEKRLTLSEFIQTVDQDFAGNEALRQYIIHKLPHYGNDNQEADAMAAWLAENILHIFQDSPMLAGRIMMPGTFSYVTHAGLGAQDGASFDGRRAHFSYSDGCGPVQGRDVNGPTAMMLSLTSWEQSAYLGGMVVNVKFAPKHLTPEHADSFIAMLRAFLQRGGIEMQVNVVDRETLLDARKHPENHRDLIVRIGGYSDYYVRLSDALQEEILERREY